MTTCLDQWSRLHRWLGRIQQTSPESPDYNDFLWAFFQACSHLKEWIRNDSSLPMEARCAMEAEASVSPALMVCAHLANGSRRFDLQKSRAESCAMPAAHALSIAIEEPAQTGAEYFVVLDDGSRVPAVNIGLQALAEWRRVFSQRGLMI